MDFHFGKRTRLRIWRLPLHCLWRWRDYKVRWHGDNGYSTLSGLLEFEGLCLVGSVQIFRIAPKCGIRNCM